MTIAIQKASSNDFSLSNILVKSIYSSRTYLFKFIGGQTKGTQTLALVPTVSDNRFTFTLIEGTDITFTELGFYDWELYEVDGSENLLCSGFMKVYDTRTVPTTPTALDGQTYVVYNG
jgi:hypothetical protein